MQVRALGYIRVSTDEQAAGADAQEASIREYCRSRGLTLVEIFSDIGISGGVPPMDRPGFSSLIEFAKANNVGVIVVYSLDRVSRDVHALLDTMAKLSSMGISIVSVRESFMANLEPMQRMLTTTLLGIAFSFERYFIRERTRRAMEALKAMGYTWSLEVGEDVKAKVRSMYISGASIRGIARELGLSTYAVRKILVEHGLIRLRPDECPRCFHRLKYDPMYDTLYCPKCGYLANGNRPQPHAR